MDETIRRNLDTQHRRLGQIEGDLDRVLAGDLSPVATSTIRRHDTADYDDLTAINDALRAERGWR